MTVSGMMIGSGWMFIYGDHGQQRRVIAVGGAENDCQIVSVVSDAYNCAHTVIRTVMRPVILSLKLRFFVMRVIVLYHCGRTYVRAYRVVHMDIRK